MFVSTELGKVSRNCTEFGWSETFPHYIEACLYEEGNGSTVVRRLWCCQMVQDSEEEENKPFFL